MKSFPILLLALLGMMPLQGRAAETDKVERLIELTDMESMMSQMSTMMMRSAEEGFVQSAQRSGLSEAQIAHGREAMNLQVAALLESLDWQSMKPEFVALLADVYTDAELDAAIAFYASPEGRSILKKQPQVMQRSMEIGQRRAMEVMPLVEAEMRKILQSIRDQAAEAAPASAEE
ncbi:MAG: DUF2059 domain-containing protein [Xanthomonadales bacterium]|nr:DUF2059 domain-containing protein [Xanthomonadales bacterium]